MLVTALLLGFLGSLHCAGMCGPLALALPVGQGGIMGFAAGRVSYNLGRVTTYCLLGVVFGLIGRTLVLAGIQNALSVALGVILILGLLGFRRWSVSGPITALVSKLKAGISGMMRRRSVFSLGVLGLLNGLLPCGLVYVACAGATTTGNVTEAVEYMAVFGLGTVPMMLGISLSGRLVPLGVRMQLRRAIPVSVFLLASLLILRGLSLGIPYLSPDLSAGAGCCH
jgi:sulfite exporter TauE/SafE